MDALITAAGRALAAGDPLGALNRVALRDDAPALALRGIAMAQLGDYAKARALLRRAGSAFGPAEAIARARCVVAEAEVALASRDLQTKDGALVAARRALEERGDVVNAAHARHVQVRRLVLIGRIEEAEREIVRMDKDRLVPAALATHELILAGIAIRRLRAAEARAALDRAGRAASLARIPALSAEVANAVRLLDAPAARLRTHGHERAVSLDDVEAVLSSTQCVVDACRFVVRDELVEVALTRRPVLFALARALGEAWPDDVTRDVLVMRAFGGRYADESHRARLRVEIGRLRRAVRHIAGVVATRRGFRLVPHRGRDVVVILRPVDEAHASVLALLADGESWSSSGLALALGSSQRSVQRALEALAASGKTEAVGHGRARRWMSPPLPGFATTLLLPSLLPAG
jgi:hypothetical protein